MNARLALLPLILVLLPLVGCAESMVTRAEKAASVLRDFATSDTPIPTSALANAEAIAVLRETEAGAVVNAGGGQGLMVQRTANGWSAPIALDSTTGSFGAQIGGKSRDVVLVFRSQLEVDRVIRDGGYSLAEAAATAGPASGEAREDDNPVQAFARVSGLYVGARLGGVKFTVNDRVNRETYGMSKSIADILGGKVDRPLGTAEFFRLLPAPGGSRTSTPPSGAQTSSTGR